MLEEGVNPKIKFLSKPRRLNDISKVYDSCSDEEENPNDNLQADEIFIISQFSIINDTCMYCFSLFYLF